MNFKKMVEERHISIPTHNFLGNYEPDGNVVAWSGYVLVTQEQAKTIEQEKPFNSLMPFPSV